MYMYTIMTNYEHQTICGKGSLFGCALIRILPFVEASMATASPSSKKTSKSKQSARELDTSNATKGVWLIKVPNYLSEVWKEAEPSSDLGLMRIGSYVHT